jgi:hypothetical protein
MEIIQFKNTSILLLIIGTILAFLGITIFINPQNNFIDILFLGLFGIGLFMLGLGLSILNQIRKYNKIN